MTWRCARGSGVLMFSRPNHQRIANVLEPLDRDLLTQHGVLFAGARQSLYAMVSIVNGFFGVGLGRISTSAESNP